MKKSIALLAALTLALSLTACGQSSSSSTPAADSSSASQDSSTTADTPAEDATVTVFAAASMQESLDQVIAQYESEHAGVTILPTYDSSGTLKTQIQEGADCDLFISAGQKQMNQLDSTASSEVNTEGLDFVDSDSRIDLLENKVTLAVPDDNPKGVESFDQLTELLKIGDVSLAIGNSDVPVGQYTLKIFDFYGLDESAIANELSYGSNVKEVTTQVSEGSVDCGIIYATDAYSAGLTTVGSATPEMCGQVIYPAAVMKSGTQAEAAQDFLNYLTTDEAMQYFEDVGFSPVA